ncbi:MAG: ferredoxin, partial [Azospira oryzae]
YQHVQPGDAGEIFDQHLEFDEPLERLRAPAGVWD